MPVVLLLVLLAACVDAPSVGVVYECTATFYCDEQPFTISPAHGCATDEADALAQFEQRLVEITEPARCASKRFEPACVATAERCTR